MRLDFQKIKAVAFDLDGTIYYGPELIEGALETVNYVRNKGLKVFFLTNNSTRRRHQIYEKLLKIGVPCSLEEVYSSGYATAEYVRRLNLQDVFVSGSDDLKEEFRNKGVSVASVEEAKNLVIGYNPKFSYEDITDALRVALKADLVIACNLDRSYPGEGGLLFPGCGAMVGAIEAASGRKSDIIVGKPSQYMLDVIMASEGLRNNEILVVGDTYDSDIMMAKNAESPSILIGNKYHPDTICVDSIAEIMSLF